jgi:hypothetical protein
MHQYKQSCLEDCVPHTRLLIPLHVNKLYHTSVYSCLPDDELLGSKHVEDIIKIKIHTGLTKVHFVGLYYTIVLHSSVQKT